MKKTPAKRYYFAYGSNTNLNQMAHRCPKAKPVGAVFLYNYTLHFNGNFGGAGVANIRCKNGGLVYGLLWEITPECEARLDRYEGFPILYTKQNIKVFTDDDTEYKAMVYVMTPAYRQPALPSKSYFNGIYEGFEQNGLGVYALDLALDETRTKIQSKGGKTYGQYKQLVY